MDPFACIAVEVRQVILEQVPNLRDLQAAILASRSLYLAYEVSRRLIRQRVFRTQILPGHLPANNDLNAAIFTRARLQIEILEQKNSNDGIILRESLWPLLISISPERKLTEILSTWSLDFAEAYRACSREQEARHIEAQVVHLLYLGRTLPEASSSLSADEEQLLVNWIHSTMTSCVRHQQYEYGVVLCDQVWDGLGLVRHQMVPGMLTALLALCPNNGHSLVTKGFLGTIIARSWALFWRSRNTSRHLDDVLCYHCLDGAMALLAATRLAHVGAEKTLSSIEEIWNEMSPRSPAASFWANLVLESHQVLGTGRLEGVLKVWNRLREVIPDDLTQFETTDLDWAREVILELRKLETGRKEDQSLEFQASVLALLNPGSPRYYAFARNLADRYLRNGDMKAALRLREQIWQDLPPTSRIYISWGRELAGLYRRIGRGEEAMLLTMGLKGERGENTNVPV